jgi:D-alanine-D-alanine ligase
MNHSDKICVGIIFGGVSAEHEVSIQSASNVLNALDTTKYQPIIIGIDTAGGWYALDEAMFAEVAHGAQPFVATNQRSVCLLPGSGGDLIDVATGALQARLQVVFPVLHGPMGEDGAIQGLLEMAGVAYVGPGVLGSAVSMDKDVMKRLLRDAGIPIAPFIVVGAAERTQLDSATVHKQLGEVVFVKPANMGSSIGVSRVASPQALAAAVDNALLYDDTVLIESEVRGSEVECAILGNESPQASILGSIQTKQGNFYSYTAKYIDADGAALAIPAALDAPVAAAARAIAVRAYQALKCEGLSRVDMFVTADGSIIVNEINTLPGFTKISMYPKLWEASDIAYTPLISRLLDLAIARKQRRSQLRTSLER